MLSPESKQAEISSQMPKDQFGEIFSGKNLGKREKTAIDVLSKSDFDILSFKEKIAIFEYSLFHDLGPAVTARKKELFGEVREDEVDRIVNRVIYNDFLVEKYDEFYKKITEEEEAGSMIKKPAEQKPPAEFGKVKRLMPKAEEQTYRNRRNIYEILSLKRKGISNKQIAQDLSLSLKHVETAVRALIFFKNVSPTSSKASIIEKQDRFLMQVAELRLKKTGNREIADKLDVDIEKVEHAARFLLWVNLIKPISKSEGGKTRWNRKENKESVRQFLNSLALNKRISLRKVHRESGLRIGYDLFASLYFELGREQQVPPVRKNAKKTIEQ